MQNIRYNAFKHAHNALRALLYDTGKIIRRTNFAHRQDAEKALRKLEHTIDLFERHAAVEDSIVFPYIQPFAPEVVADFEGQHRVDHELSSSLATMIASCREVTNPHQRIVCWIKLLHDFNEFIAFNLRHMNKEEVLINPIFWDHYTDEEIRQIMSEVSPLTPRRFFDFRHLATHPPISLS